MAEKEQMPGENGNSDPVGTISEQERDWAQAALADFNRGSYATCLQNLSKLEASRPHDTKVAHNKAVAEYYKNDLKKTDQFRKNMNIVCAQANFNIEDIDSLEDVEHCIIFYNQAVLLYHLHQHQAALKIMNKIFTFIEPMEESLAHRVCLLLIELHLCTQQPDKTLSLIAYIENQFVSTDNATKMIGDKEMKTLEKEHQEKAPVSLDAATDAFRLKLLHYRARCYLNTCALKACKRELKTIVATSNPNNQTMIPVFLKANLEYLRGNFNKAIKVLGTIPLKTSNTVFENTGESPSVLYHNNMGCLHHYMGKPNLASFFINKALQENINALKVFSKTESGEQQAPSRRPLYAIGGNKAPQLMYNIGVVLLHGGKPLQAFDCLTEAVQVYHMNPRLWLRLAECCIMVHKQSNAVDFDFNSRRKELIQGVVNSGIHKKIIINPEVCKDKSCSNDTQSFAIPVASMEFASLCLRNALILLPSADTNNTVYAPPSPPIDPRQVPSLRACVLTASAYVSLCLGDPLLALEHSKALLSQPNISGVHKLLGRLYLGEAFILLDKLSLAIDILNPETCQEICDPNVKPLRPWFPQNVQSAKTVMQYNMAVVLALRGELDKAGEMLKQVWKSKSSTCEVPVHVIVLALYIELLLGHADIARNIVRQNCPQLQR
uniref:CCR4-NOT transcription complex subunit 10 n=1 Tax=Clastoptera arizonana TaxID=38151 RepID=A0A1B6E480_9HEMI